MADTFTRVEATEPSPPPRTLRVTLVAVLGLVVLLAGVWVLVAAQQRSQVAVWFDGQPLACADAPMLENLEDEFDPIHVHVVDAAADLDCRLRVQVENRGWLPATVRGVVLPMYGPGAGGGIQARELSPLAVSPAAEDATGWPALDAVYTFDQRLEAGDRLVLHIGLEHKPDGCMSQDALAWLTDAPLVDVSVLGLSGTRTPTGVAFAQRGTADSDCDVP